MAATEYYDHTTYPANGAFGSSSVMRAELAAIEAGFGKLPDLSGNASKIVAVKSDESGLEAVSTTGTGNAVRAASPTTSGTHTHTGDVDYSGSAKRIKGDFSNATTISRLWFQDRSNNAVTAVGAMPSGTGAASYWVVSNGSNPDNAAYALIGIDGSFAYLETYKNGSGTALPLRIKVNNATAATFGTDGNLDLEGFTAMGNGAPAVKQKKLSGTTGAAGATTTAAHGLTYTKIIGLQVLIQEDGGTLVPAYSETTVIKYSLSIDGTNVNITLDAGATAIDVRPYTVLLTYEE